MSGRVIVLGAGMGGLAAALRLARAGRAVTVLEAADGPGGLARAEAIGGFRFDAGPYILLDRPGLEWAFERLGVDADARLHIRRVPEVYEVAAPGASPVRIQDSLDATADDIGTRWPGADDRYRRFVRAMAAAYARMQPLQRISRPGLRDVLGSGAWRDIPFLLKPLSAVLRSTGLPDDVVRALAVWTHVAGQTLEAAPSPLALVPSLIHSAGAYVPEAGIGSIPRTLADEATAEGVAFRWGARVRRILTAAGRVRGVECETGEVLETDRVISNLGLATYLHVLDPEGARRVPARRRAWLENLPLQSPGVCAYLAVRGAPPSSYLRFHLRDEPDGCRLLVSTPAVLPETVQEGWWPARLIAPMNHTRAVREGESGQRGFLEQVLTESWWREGLDEVRILATRTPGDWARDAHLFRQSMNPVMTAAFMRAGRLAHRSPWIGGLYLAGSATHPGQWVSFCAISGVLAAELLLGDSGDRVP